MAQFRSFVALGIPVATLLSFLRTQLRSRASSARTLAIQASSDDPSDLQSADSAATRMIAGGALSLRTRFLCALVFAACSGLAVAGGTTAGAALPSVRYALPAPRASATVETAAIDAAAELLADQTRPRSLPLRYAAERAIDGVRTLPKAPAVGGEWRDLADGMALWRIPVHVAGARSLDFTFRRFFLPPGAQLFVRGGSETLGPYSDADNARSRRFATPLVHADRAQIEVLLPQAMKSLLELDLEATYAGYRDIFAPKSIRDPGSGSGTCNIDTICSQGDPWRSEINAEAVLVSTGTYCSGQLLNNTRGDRLALLSTAHHCYASQEAGDRLVVYWKYESSTCRAIGSVENGLPVSSATAIAQTGGGALLATDEDSDFTLFRLENTPPAGANAYYNGWDLSEASFSDGVVIHHPQADAKRISFTGGAIQINEDTSVGEGIHHWYVDHYAAGTTEEGSSGSGLFDSQHRLRGVLSNGSAACSEPNGYDYYGRLSSAWTGGGTAQTRVSDWLDPIGSRLTRLDGLASCAAPTVTLSLSESSALVGDKITLSASATGGSAPYSYAFDVDGDGVADSTDPTQTSIPAVYPGAYAGNVSVKVTDSTGCSATASRALVVQAADIHLAAAPVPAPIALCGSSDGSINPGQRWRNQVVLINSGNATSDPGYAIFAQDPATIAQASLTLETPAVALPALAPGESTSIALDYAIDGTTACGSPVNIDLLGAADARGFHSAPSQVVSRVLAAQCLAVTACPAQVPARRLDSVAYYDPLRPGTGMALINLSQGANDPLIFGLWFSADSSRQPTWYQVQAPLHGDQVNSPLYRAQQTQPPTWPLRPTAIGSAQVTLVDDDKFAFTWNFAGNVGGALYVPVTGIASRVRLWNSPTESGWGTYDQLVQASGPTAPPLIASLVYIYDAAGVPRWVQGNNGSYVTGATETVMLVRPTCPGCVWLDYKAGQQAVGSMIYVDAGGQPQLSTNIDFPGPLSGNWVRNQLPVTLLFQSQ